MTIVGCGGPTQDTVVSPGRTSNHPAPLAVSDAPEEQVVPIGNPSRENSVVVAAAIFPSQAKPGDVVTLAVRLRTAAAWHFFAVGDDVHGGPVLPTKLKLDLPAGVSKEGGWELPETDTYDGPTGRSQGYSGDVTFRQRLKVDEAQPPGTLTLPITVSYQACSDSICTRPAPVELRPTLQVVAP